MFKSASAILRDWIVFHQTFAALKQLDPHLLGDLGLSETDLRRVSRKAMDKKGPINLSDLREIDDELRGDVSIPIGAKAPSADAPVRRSARGRQRLHRRLFPA